MKIKILVRRVDENGNTHNSCINHRFVFSAPEIGSKLQIDGGAYDGYVFTVEKVVHFARLCADDPPFHQVWATVYVA